MQIWLKQLEKTCLKISYTLISSILCWYAQERKYTLCIAHLIKMERNEETQKIVDEGYWYN